MAAETTANQKVVSRGHRKKGRSCALSGVASTFELAYHLVDVSGPRNIDSLVKGADFDLPNLWPRKYHPENFIPKIYI